MGVRIKSTGISSDGDTFSIVDHSGRAARRSLERAGDRGGLRAQPLIPAA
ncbi:hypothetical protein [Nocardia wallacei]|nr:hypothetical protein [Nocardia wallacei]